MVVVHGGHRARYGQAPSRSPSVPSQGEIPVYSPHQSSASVSPTPMPQAGRASAARRDHPQGSVVTRQWAATLAPSIAETATQNPRTSRRRIPGVLCISRSRLIAHVRTRGTRWTLQKLEAGHLPKASTELSMFNSLAGRTAIVTGASKGIGRGIARRLGAVGCSVLVVARSRTESESVAREITAAKGNASAFSADVSDEAETKAMAAAAVERYGSVDILCANAGIFPASKLDVMSGAEFDSVLTTNLRGTFLSVSACLPALKQAKGRIVVTSSITGPITGYPGWSHYGASKAGQLGFIRTAAVELAPAGVTINAV